MNYRSEIKDNYNLHIIETNRFKEMSVTLFLTKNSSCEDTAISNMLCKNLVYSSKKYNTKNAMAIIGEELYDTKVSASYGFNGESECFVFSVDMLNPLYIDKSFLSKSMDFFSEVLFNPNVCNNSFNEEYFNILKRDYISNLESIKDNPKEYGNIRFNSIFYKDYILGKCIPTVSEVEEIDPKKLYDFYNKLFNGEYNIDIFIYGENVSKYVDTILPYFDSIKGCREKISFKVHEEEKIINGTNEIVESNNFSQSRLYFGYRLINATNHELNHVIKLYNIILGSMNDSLLFNYVREKYSLCYSVHSSFNKYYPSIIIYAGINKDNYEEAKKRIFECMEQMKDKKIVNKLFNQAKKTFNTYLNSFYDESFSQINFYYSKIYDKKEDIEELRKSINEVTIDEVIELNEKIVLDTIYLLKGDN